MAWMGPRGKNVAIASAIPVFWMCVWLIVSHMEHAASPVLLGHVYGFFARAALLLALYYIAGYAFNQARSGRLLFASSISIYFIAVHMGDPMRIFERITLLALAATVLIYQLTLTANLKYPDAAVGNDAAQSPISTDAMPPVNPYYAEFISDNVEAIDPDRPLPPSSDG